MTTEIKAQYDDDCAIFMLASMFNQFALGDVTKAYHSSKGNYYTAMEVLLDKQAKTGRKPKVAIKPRIPERRVRGGKISFKVIFLIISAFKLFNLNLPINAKAKPGSPEFPSFILKAPLNRFPSPVPTPSSIREQLS